MSNDIDSIMQPGLTIHLAFPRKDGSAKRITGKLVECGRDGSLLVDTDLGLIRVLWGDVDCGLSDEDLASIGQSEFPSPPVPKWRSLTDRQVIEIRQRRASGESAISLAECYGVSAKHISEITNGRRWRSLL